MTTDQWGNPFSHRSAAARTGVEAATLKLHAYQADPLADIDAVLAEHPDCAMAHAFRANLLVTTLDRAFLPELQRSLAAAGPYLAAANDRERGHLAAAQAWAEGDLAGAIERWSRVAIDHPRDLLAVQIAQIGDFALGYSHMLRDRVARVLPHWHRGLPGYGFLLGMHAFGLEESGDYAQAEAAGREGVALNPQDGWAVHAVAHVLEMTGRAEEGIAFLRDTAGGWAPGSMFAAHNWWHLALFHLDRGETAEALRLFDAEITENGFDQALNLVDGAALLWRIQAIGGEVGDRWAQVAPGWRERLEDGFYAFNDLHAMMACIGTGDMAGQQALLEAAARAAQGGGTNAMMTREVGLPACRGFAAFGRGDYAEAVRQLLPVRALANRFGGSHAQRDVLAWTLLEAAIRGGDRPLAEALLAERLALKPASPVNLDWRRRAAALAVRLAA